MNSAEYCPACNEAILWKCSACEKESERSVHTLHPPAEEASGRSTAMVSTALGVMSGLYVFMPV